MDWSPADGRRRSSGRALRRGAAVTYARRQAGLTKTELAQRCGVSLSLISEIESGTRNATPAMIRKLAAAMNCPRVILERKRDDDAPIPPGHKRSRRSSFIPYGRF